MTHEKSRIIPHYAGKGQFANMGCCDVNHANITACASYGMERGNDYGSNTGNAYDSNAGSTNGRCIPVCAMTATRAKVADNQNGRC